MVKKSYSTVTARTAFMVALVSLAIIVLAACGSSTATSDTPTLPTSAPTSAVAAPTAVMTGTGTGTGTDMTPMATSQATPQAQDTPTSGTGGGTGTSDPTATTSGLSSGGTATEIKGVLKEWAITLSQQEAPAGKISFIVTNEGQMRHNFTVMDSSGQKIDQTTTFAGSQGAQTLEVNLQAGTYTIICDLPGHAARGQQTTLTVK